MRRTGLAALAAVLLLAGCTGRDRNEPAAAPAPAAATAPATPTATPTSTAERLSAATTATGGKKTGFTTFATACPQVGERAGAAVGSPVDTAASRTERCAYGSGSGLPRVTSLATIAKPGHRGGTAERSTRDRYASAVKKARTRGVDGVATQKRTGLGDEAVLVTSFKDGTTQLVVRRGNALIQTSATVAALGDREQELLELQKQEQVLTELARSLLAELR